MKTVRSVAPARPTMTSTSRDGQPATDGQAGPEATRERLLSVAETLFGSAGYHAVSLREIAGEAGVNVALIGYHFGSKENLFKAAFRRNAAPVIAARLAAVRTLGPAPSLTQILEAWAMPVLRYAAGRERKAFMRLSGILRDEKLPFLDGLVRETYGPTNALYLDALTVCLPTLSRATLGCRLSFLIGIVSAASGPLPASITGANADGDGSGTGDRFRLDQLIAFALAGFQAPEPEDRKDPR